MTGGEGHAIATPRAVSESLKWDRFAGQVISGSTSTLAKSPSRLIRGVSPYFTVEARGAFFTDLDGNEWLDCEMGMGANVWGHAHPRVVEAIVDQARRGNAYSTPDVNEARLAKGLLDRFPEYERVRFLKSGADAVTASIRIARVKTGRSRVITTEYHGWGSESVAGLYGDAGASKLGLAPGSVAQRLFVQPHHLHAVLEQLRTRDDIAAVIVCPSSWTKAEVQDIRDECTRTGTLLIFDEVTSGQRYGKQATAGRYQIWPDILCLAKGLANGLPLAAILGAGDLIDLAIASKVTTAHATESLAFAAALACEELLATRRAWPSWEDAANQMIVDTGDVIQALSCDKVEIVGDHASFALRASGHADFWTDPVRHGVVAGLARHGIFTKGYVVLSDAHSANDFERIRLALIETVRTVCAGV